MSIPCTKRRKKKEQERNPDPFEIFEGADKRKKQQLPHSIGHNVSRGPGPKIGNEEHHISSIQRLQQLADQSPTKPFKH